MGSLSRFISDFKTFAAFQDWDAAKQASLLPLCLTGVARDAYDCLPEASKKSISLAFEGLKQAFPARGVVEAQVKLRNLKFDPRDDLDAFAIRLKGLVSTAFPGSEADSLFFNYFMQSLPIPFQSRLVSDGVTSFDAALTTVRNMCCADRLNASQPAPVRQVLSEADLLRQRVEELESKLARLEGGRSSRPSRVERRVCFCCGGEGHVRRDCRSRNSICYVCGVRGHLARVCSAGAAGNPSGAVGSVPPGRPLFRQRGAMTAPDMSSVLASQTSQPAVMSHPTAAHVPQVQPVQHVTQGSSAAGRMGTPTA